MSPRPIASRQTVRAHAQRAEEHWMAAVNAFLPLPDRLRDLADAAEEQARVLRLAELSDIPWEGDDMTGVTLIPGLDSGAAREGPPELWIPYEEASERLTRALESTSNREVYEAYEALRDRLFEIADALTEQEDPVKQPGEQRRAG